MEKNNLSWVLLLSYSGSYFEIFSCLAARWLARFVLDQLYKYFQRSHPCGHCEQEVGVFIVFCTENKTGHIFHLNPND